MIRKTIYAAALCCLAAGVSAQVSIEGKIKKYKGQTVSFSHYKGKYDVTDTVRVAKNGTFRYETENILPNSVNVDGTRAFLYLQPGDHLQVEINTTNGQAVVFSFKGDHAAENNYQQATAELERRVMRLNKGEYTSFTAYREALEETNAYALEQLQAVTEPKIRERGEAMASLMVNMLSFRYYDRNREQANADPDFRAFVENLDFTDTKRVDNNIIHCVVNWHLDKAGITDGKERTLSYFDTAAKLIPDETIRNSVLSAAMWSCLMGDKIPWIDEAFAAYKAVTTDKAAIAKYASEVERHLNHFRVRNGVQAPDFEVVDSLGQRARLSDFRGKFVYIDVWATWCAPCCAEIPHVEKLHAQFAGDPRIEFISISVDSKTKAWREKVAADAPAWRQYIAEGGTSSPFYRAYAIEFIPRFMLIGSDGKIIEIDYMKPSKPGCADDLRARLDKAFAE